MIADSGGKLYACKASVDMFDLKQVDFMGDVEEIITVGDFYGSRPAGRSFSPDRRRPIASGSGAGGPATIHRTRRPGHIP